MEKALPIRLLAMDVDGVLTGGEVMYSNSGEELKVFNILDGCGIVVARHAGLMTAIITGRESSAVERRAFELRIDYPITGCRDKGAAIRDLFLRAGVHAEEVAFVGDDLNDILAFQECGWKVAVSDACDDLKAQADYITKRRGGDGAVREIIELILKAQGKWADAVDAYLNALKEADAGPHHPAHQ
jgi:3-deoxy-D-manno-octulosonate 8-phosphate phosphatase (KDO 8-P phosphatase)